MSREEQKDPEEKTFHKKESLGEIVFLLQRRFLMKMR